MRSLEKLEALAEKKRESIKVKQNALKKEQDALKGIEAEIEICKGEAYRKDIHNLDLTKEEFEKFRKCVLSNKTNLLEVISLMEKEGDRQKEGAAPVYE